MRRFDTAVHGRQVVTMFFVSTLLDRRRPFTLSIPVLNPSKRGLEGESKELTVVALSFVLQSSSSSMEKRRSPKETKHRASRVMRTRRRTGL